MHTILPCKENGLRCGPRANLLLLLTLAFLPAAQAWSQSSAVPRQEYFLAKSMLADGDFVRASRSFDVAARSGIRSTEGRWVDSICYYTMIGECLYQMGYTADALERFEAALQLYVAHQGWLTALDFPIAIQASGRARRPVTWAASRRRTAIGHVPNTINSLQGRLDNLRVLSQGGVFAPLQLVPIHAEEIVQCTALALRRRMEIMGPTCRYTPLTVQLLAALSRRQAPANHWSQSWISLQLGLAYASVGQVPAAIAQLQQSILIGSQFDHVLTSVALVELGKLAFRQAQYPQAMSYFMEASISAGLFEEYRTVEESLHWASLTHQVTGGAGLFEPLPAAAAWARTQSDFVEASVYVSAAENFVRVGEPAKAMAMIDRATGAVRRHDTATGKIGARMSYVTALANYQVGKLDIGDVALDRVMKFQRLSSHWLLQVAQTDALYAAGAIGERAADDLYSYVLREPTSADWVVQPREAIVFQTTPHPLPMEHWFQVVMQRKEFERGIEISDRIRRHRFYSTLPMGGRLLALRWVLAAPEDALSPKALLQRQDLLNNYPKYVPVAQRAQMISQQLKQLPIVAEEGEQFQQRQQLYAQLASVSMTQEIMMREMALQGDAAQFCYPRIRDIKALQQVIPKGQLVLAFLATSRGMLVFAMDSKKYEYWQLASTGKLTLEIKTLLRELGNYDKNVDIKLSNLASDKWKESSTRIAQLLFAGAPETILDNITQLVIVPDGPLWYLPFEALIWNEQPLIEQMAIRYSPYVSLTMGDGRNHAPLARTGFIAAAMVPGEDEQIAEVGAQQFADGVKDSVRLTGELPAPSSMVAAFCERLFVMSELYELPKAPYLFSPIPLDRGRPGSTLENWMSLPWSHCQQLALPAFHTPAENALKRGGTGTEVFLSINGLMAAGVRTVVLSRWRTGGKTSYDLMNQLARRLPDTSADIAWQQGVGEVRQQPLELASEPRVSGRASEGMLTSHPWFWAGYIVTDIALAPGQPQPGATIPDAIPAAMRNKPAAGGNKEKVNDANNGAVHDADRRAVPEVLANNDNKPANPFGQAPNRANRVVPSKVAPPEPDAQPVAVPKPGEVFKFKPPPFIKRPEGK